MMKISHISNSFIVVDSNETRLICDPWVGRANYGGWHSFPEYGKEDLANIVREADYIYISHIHDDHLDKNFLDFSDVKNKTFVIKNFRHKHLLNKLKLYGIHNIVEVEEFSRVVLKDLSVAIFPQMTSTSSGVDDDVNYDMDTSIVISDSKNIFFNQVDNPLSSDDFIHIANWIKKEFGSIDVACLMCGAAGEYPQFFMNINQRDEKERIVTNSLVKLLSALDALSPKYYFPAGGTYFIPGKLAPFNKGIAQPTFDQITLAIKNSSVDVKPLFLEGGRLVELNNDEISFGNLIDPIVNSIDQSIALHELDLYDFEYDQPPNVEELLRIFSLSRNNWLEKVSKEKIKISQNIEFYLYSQLKICDGKPDPDKKLLELQLFKSPHKLGSLGIHIDIRAFRRCLTRTQVWNGTLGALCLFDRSPNIHYPNDFFVMNFLGLSKSQLDNLSG
jgi:UDP-MurNAc hydroxylase